MAGRMAFVVMVGCGHTNLLSQEFSPGTLVPGAWEAQVQESG